jgi:hypothetical protein
MRAFWIGLTALCLAAGAASAEPASAPMKQLFEEMKSHAELEKRFREEKKSQIQGIEAQIDALRAEAKAKGAEPDKDAVRKLQMRRLDLIGTVASRDVQAAEDGLRYAQRKLEIAKQNLAAFEAKKAEAEGSLKA